ncbi:hypothetical protein PENANT_c028G03103 [Penicillium antarcticum]|uniref:Uncharacterized protein n=1 Tax=Penicillium antarcticum TaxID=416450 RepID=A0A1V6PXA8_9EURO|nr:hypothetical protein PENANT_c028G03103 [Penicillium antarcticum]
MSSAFQMLAAESPKLRALLSQDKMQHSQQPIFSVLDELVLQNFPAVFRKGLDDHALLSAAMLRISFAITDGYIDVECLRYQGQALSSIRRRMSSPDMATTESTLGAILLLVGVEVYSHLLGADFVDVLKDVFALQCIRDSTFFGKEDTIAMANIDNHQASIQSRLSHLSLQLLCKLQEVNPDLLWDDWPELLAWLLHIGGAFAPTGNIRSAYLALLHLNRNTRLENLYSSWPSLLEILKQFIWSEKAFEAQVKAFYEESHI